MQIETERLVLQRNEREGHAEESVLRAEEKRWSRRWRDALSWFISNGNKLGISPPACLICEYAEHPTPDSSPLIKAWLGAQVAIAHLYENTWWWFYTESSFRMEPMCQRGGWSWEAHAAITPHTSAVQFWDSVSPAVQMNEIKSQCGSCMTEAGRRWNSLRRVYIRLALNKLSAKTAPDHMVRHHLTLLINKTIVFMRQWLMSLFDTFRSQWAKSFYSPADQLKWYCAWKSVRQLRIVRTSSMYPERSQRCKNCF